MKETLVKYISLLIIALAIVISGSVLLGGISGCARVFYKDITPSVKCNFSYMLIQLKSLKGGAAFEVGKYVDECFNDLDKIKCIERIYGKDKITNDKIKRLEFMECLKE